MTPLSNDYGSRLGKDAIATRMLELRGRRREVALCTVCKDMYGDCKIEKARISTFTMIGGWCERRRVSVRCIFILSNYSDNA